MNSHCRSEDFQSQKGRSLGTVFKRKTEAKHIAFKMETDCFTHYMSWQSAVTADNFCTGPFPNSCVVIKLRWIHKPGYKRRITDERSRSLDQKHACSQESICCCATSFLTVCRVWDTRRFQDAWGEPRAWQHFQNMLYKNLFCHWISDADKGLWQNDIKVILVSGSGVVFVY